MGIDAKEMNPAGGAPDENRRALRKPVDVSVQLRDGRSPKFTCRMIDLSATGFRAEAASSLHVGDTVWVTLPGMSGIEAEIAWRDDFTIGCRFRQPLYPAVFETMVRVAER